MSDDISPEMIQSLDSVDVIERKRLKLDGGEQKHWSFTEKQADHKVMEEMGVGILSGDESDETVASCSHLNVHKGESKRKRDIENVSPNVTSSCVRASPRRAARHRLASPTSPSFAAGEVKRCAEENILSERSLNETYEPCDEETPVPLLPAAHLHGKRKYRSPTSSAASSGCSGGSGSSGQTPSVFSATSPTGGDYTSPSKSSADILGDSPVLKTHTTTEDLFEDISDEVMLQVFKWLPKRCLVRCALVCRRWHRIASDESLWTRLELGEKIISRGALGRILAKKPVVLRLANAEIGEWQSTTQQTPSRIQYLDLSMASITPHTLNALLRCCHALRRLSLETLALNSDTLRCIGACKRLETLNMTMATGVEPDALADMLQGCRALQSLNISWCGLTAAAASVVCSHAPDLLRLNLAGARTLTDHSLATLVHRCSELQELDISDCTKITEIGLTHVIDKLHKLEHLAISRCYSLLPTHIAQVKSMPALQYLDVWGMLQATSLTALKTRLPSLRINQYMLSAIARPTVGPRRTSIWGVRTRD